MTDHVEFREGILIVYERIEIRHPLGTVVKMIDSQGRYVEIDLVPFKKNRFYFLARMGDQRKASLAYPPGGIVLAAAQLGAEQKVKTFIDEI